MRLSDNKKKKFFRYTDEKKHILSNGLNAIHNNFIAIYSKDNIDLKSADEKRVATLLEEFINNKNVESVPGEFKYKELISSDLRIHDNMTVDKKLINLALGIMESSKEYYIMKGDKFIRIHCLGTDERAIIMAKKEL